MAKKKKVVAVKKFVLLQQHTHDRLYRKGENINLSDERLIKVLTDNKIIKICH